TILSQPTGQICTVDNASGELPGQAIANVAVDCLTIQLDLSSGNVEFMPVNPGSDDEQTLTLTNSGPVNLVIEDFVAPHAPFGFDAMDCAPLPRTLTPGETCTVLLSFAPLSDGTFDDQLVIVSNALASPSQVGLFGNGTRPAIPVPALGLPALLLLMLSLLIVASGRLASKSEKPDPRKGLQ
ncbi:MAG: choice-of-anchor D domain-containing protein, partial [Wenzhouxiangella sp.]